MSQDEYVRDKVSALQEAVTQDRLEGEFKNYEFAVQSLIDIIMAMSVSYDDYRKPVSKVLYIFEWLKVSLLPYAMPLMEDYCSVVLNDISIIPDDLSIMDELIDDEVSALFSKALENTLSKNNRIEMASFEFDISGLSTVQLRRMLSLIMRILQYNTESIEWDQERVEVMFLNVAAGRYLAGLLGELDVFYFSLGMFLDRLFVSGRQQHARDMSENFLLCSFIDGVPEWGFFLEFKAFSAQGDISASLLYSLLYLNVIIKKGTVSEILLKETAWQFVKFYRNISLFDAAIKFYHSIPERIKFGPYKTRALKQTLFSCMLFKNDNSLPELVLDYLNQEREEILRGGMHDCLPWLILLYNIRRQYNNANYSSTGLGFYTVVFETIVPEEMIASFKKLLVESEDNSAILIDDLKKSIMKLSEARSLSDYSYDNEMSLKISRKVVMSDDVEGYLIAMMIKSDFGLFFHEKISPDKNKFSFSDANPANFYQYFGDYRELHLVDELKQYEVVWLSVGERLVRQCSLFEGVFEIRSLVNWEHRLFEAVKEALKPLLIHEVTKKVRGQVQMLVEEDYEYQVESIKKYLWNTRISVGESKALFLIKDMELSSFPHNLLLNQNGEFLFLERPIINVLSTDRLQDSLNSREVINTFSKGIWIPTQAGDLAISRLYGSIELLLNELRFNIFNSVSVEEPLSYDLNVLVCHGADDISKFNAIYPGGKNILFNIEGVVGPGKILVLFICHSGSMDKDIFQNQISTLIKRFLDLGYESIVAPFWALSIDVPPIWLPVFMCEFKSGALICDCVWKANMAVRDNYPNSTPATWACLHLYGNPFLKIGHPQTVPNHQ